MKPQRFEIGQAVTPKIKSWDTIKGPSNSPNARFGEIYHVSAYRDKPYNGQHFISLRELTCALPLFFAESEFDPIELSSESISALLEETQSQIV